MSTFDVDDLLDELNGVLGDEKGAPKGPPKTPPLGSSGGSINVPPRRHAGGAATKSSSGSVEDDIDALLGDLDGAGLPPAAKAGQYQQHQQQQRAPPPPVARPTDSSGNSSGSSATTTTASNLRCSKCDFKVLCFHGREWSAGVDYMFFRNYMPNVTRLEQQLVAKDGHAAYACQCAWASVEIGDPHMIEHWFVARGGRID